MAFNGLATTETGYFGTLAEDVSDVVSMISPQEAPILDILGTSMFPATNLKHQWMEDALAPNTIQTSAAIVLTTAQTTITVKGGLAAYLMEGSIIQELAVDPGEYMQIVSISGDDIVVKRAFGGTSAHTISADASFMVIAEAQAEGRDVAGDISRIRILKENYTQIFMKDVWVSGSVEAVKRLGGIESELDYQIQNRLREALRDLNKCLIRGIPVATTPLGTSAQGRAFGGINYFLTTNATTSAVTFGDTNAKIEAALNLAHEKAWLRGGSDIDLIVCGSKVKERLDQMNSQRIQTVQQERVYSNVVSIFEGTYGRLNVLMDRWCPPYVAYGLATRRIGITPLQSRSFHYMPTAKTGDSEKGYVCGEYTVEVRNEEGMYKLSFTDASFKASAYTP